MEHHLMLPPSALFCISLFEAMLSSSGQSFSCIWRIVGWKCGYAALQHSASSIHFTCCTAFAVWRLKKIIRISVFLIQPLIRWVPSVLSVSSSGWTNQLQCHLSVCNWSEDSLRWFGYYRLGGFFVITYKDIPSGYPLCLHGDCPMVDRAALEKAEVIQPMKFDEYINAILLCFCHVLLPPDT